MPLILKGIATAEDAGARLRARRRAPSTSRTMAAGSSIMAAARSTCCRRSSRRSAGAPRIIVDGGFCRGTDIVKAMALGADRRRHRPAHCYGARGGGRGRASSGCWSFSRTEVFALPRPSRRHQLRRARPILPLAGGAGRDAARPQRLPADRHSGRWLLTATPRQKISPGLVASSSGQIGRLTLV